MVAPNLPTFMGTAYGWASRHHSHWYLNIDCLTCPWGRENLQKEGRSGTEDWQEFNFVSHWLRSPQRTEFLPFTEEETEPSARLGPGQVPTRQCHLCCYRSSERLSRADPLNVHQAESANWAKRRKSPGNQNPRKPRAQLEFRSEH